jgi:iron complex outermembrane receptor protein
MARRREQGRADRQPPVAIGAPDHPQCLYEGQRRAVRHAHAGAAKIAVGGELTGYGLHQDIVRPNNLGVASQNSQYLSIDYRRNVASAYAELYVPLIKDGFVNRSTSTSRAGLTITTILATPRTPRSPMNFEPVRGIKIRANWAKSFVAPALTSIGSNGTGLTGESGFRASCPAAFPVARPRS